MTQLRRSAVVAIVLVLMGASAAQAVTTLYTAAQARGGRTFACLVLNVGTRDVTVRTQMVDINGVVDVDPGDEVIDPGKLGGVTVASTAPVSATLYCKFIVVMGNKALLRASACVFDASGTACQTSSEAR